MLVLPLTLPMVQCYQQPAGPLLLPVPQRSLLPVQRFPLLHPQHSTGRFLLRGQQPRLQLLHRPTRRRGCSLLRWRHSRLQTRLIRGRSRLPHQQCPLRMRWRIQSLLLRTRLLLRFLRAAALP